MNAARRLTLKVLVSLCALVGLLALAAAPGQAFDKHSYLSQFSEVPALGPHGEAIPLPGPLSLTNSNSIAVDGGEVYVAEGGSTGSGTASRLDKFDAATGAFISQFPQVSSSSGLVYLDQGVAVGHAGGKAEVYVGGDEEVEGSPHGVVVVFNTAGELQRVWTGVGAPSKERFQCFECSGSGSVAVDASGLGWAAGDVYVADPRAGVVDVFEPETGGGEKLVAQIDGTSPSEPFVGPTKVAVEEGSGNVLVAQQGSGGSAEVDIFRPASISGQYEFVGKLALPSGLSMGNLNSLSANGSASEIYVASEETKENGKSVPDQVLEFNSAGEFAGRIDAGTVPGGSFGNGLEHPEGSHPESVAADPATHEVYVATASDRLERPAPVFVFGPDIVLPDVATLAPSSVGPRSATLNGTVDLEKAGAASCQFVWGTSPSLGEVAKCPGALEGEGKVPVSVTLTGLQPDTTYYYRLQATNANGTNPGEPTQDTQLKTTGPGLGAEAVTEVASTSATLEATLNPDGAPTSYYFQYGRSSEYESEAPLAPGTPIGSESEAVSVGQHVQGLAAGTVYHYRVVAVSELEVEPKVLEPVAFPGPDQVFTTQAAGSARVLPDGRQWELVSPPEKRGGLINVLGFALTQSSAAGDSIMYTTTAPPEGDVKGYTVTEQMLSTRGPAGWSSQNISLPHPAATGLVSDNYFFASNDLSLAVVFPQAAESEFSSLSPEASPPDTEPTPYLRHDLTCATTPATCFQPLVTSAPGFADEPAGKPSFGGAAVVGGTPDLTHVLFGAGQLYEWSAGEPPAEELQPVSILPASEGGTAVAGALDVMEVDKHALSEDGSRVVWTYGQGLSHGLYLRDGADTTKGQTIRLDVVQGGSGLGLVSPQFQAASSDGSMVFFTDSQHLTKSSGASGEGDLYECEIVEVAGAPTCALSDLTPGSGGQNAGVLGKILGASEDGSYLYFVASGAPLSGENDRHEAPISGAPNLYMLHYDRSSAKWEAPRLIAVLSAEDSPDWAKGPYQPARVSPDGRYLAFMSDRSLTGYDNRDARSHVPDEEVFLFGARDGRLACASCNPTGARPAGIEYGAKIVPGGPRLTQEGLWGSDRWIAAQVPIWGSGEAHQPRYLSDQGRLFFDSSDALVPQDINGNQDVYEYEPAGVGGCSTASATFSGASGGCAGLITSGTAPGESALLDASENGDDVFFLTEKLLPVDPDTALDVYDARVCTSDAPCSSPPTPSPACQTADACRAAPLPQPAVFGAPASATFSGAGNITPSTVGAAVQGKKKQRLTRAQKLARALSACRRVRQKRRAACERQARKRGGAKQSSHELNTRKRGKR